MAGSIIWTYLNPLHLKCSVPSLVETGPKVYDNDDDDKDDAMQDNGLENLT